MYLMYIAQSVQRLGYGLDDRGSRVRFPEEAWNFSLHHRVQNGSGAHPASNQWVPVALSRGVRGRGVKLTAHLHLLLRSRMRGAILPVPLYVFVAWWLVKHRDNFTFTFMHTYMCVCARALVRVCVNFIGNALF
jgi:hypothetical protein